MDRDNGYAKKSRRSDSYQPRPDSSQDYSQGKGESSNAPKASKPAAVTIHDVQHMRLADLCNGCGWPCPPGSKHERGCKYVRHPHFNNEATVSYRASGIAITHNLLALDRSLDYSNRGPPTTPHGGGHGAPGRGIQSTPGRGYQYTPGRGNQGTPSQGQQPHVIANMAPQMAIAEVSANAH